MKVEKRDGRIVPFDKSKIHRAIEKAFISCDEDTSAVAGVVDIVMEVVTSEGKATWHIEELQDIVEDSLMTAGYTDVARSYIKYRQKRHQLRQLRALLGVTDDLKLGINAATLLNRRYLLKDREGNVTETPSQLFRRVAKAVASIEAHYDRSANGTEVEDLFYHMMVNLEFLPNSPTLFNAGTELGQLSACFVVPIEDSMDSIFQAVWQMAKIQKSGGGCVREGTPILTKEFGLVPIEEIPGFEEIEEVKVPHTIPPVTLYTWNPELQIFEERVVDKGWKFQLNETARINYGSNGVIETSLWHPFFVWDGMYITTKRADELVPGDWLLKNGLLDIQTPERDSDLWWLIGYIIADGCFDNSVNGLRLRIFDQRHEILERANRIISQRRGTPLLKLQKDPREDCFYLQTTSKKKDSFVHFLYDIVGPEKLKPSFTPDGPLSFIAGLLDGDGHFGRDIVSLYTASDSLKDFICEILSKIGINYKVRTRTRKRFNRVCKGWEIAFGIGYCRIFPTVREPRLCRYKPTTFRKIRVKSVEILKEKATLYDFTVPLTENYLAGTGHLTVVHNTGFAFSRLRPKDAPVGSTGGVASGPVSFMRIFDTTTDVIKQGGVRRGANMGVLRVDHPDILEFIRCKADKVSYRNFNISVAVTDKFMEAYFADEEYELIDPHTRKVTEKLSARFVFEQIAHYAWLTGDPGILFIDRINQAHPLKGEEIEATNPCGEVPLLGYECCVLGSINLSKFVKDGKVDYKHLGEVVALGVRFLDNVIDANKYPFNEIDIKAKAGRKIGLGIMGFAEMLIQLGVPYDSKEGLQWGRDIMRFINERARKASSKLAKLRGNFELKGQSKIRAQYRRNATVNTIAPTGSIGIIAGTSSGIEPLFGISYVRVLAEGVQLHETNKYFEQIAKEQGFWDETLAKEIAKTGSVQHIDLIPAKVKALFKTAHEIPPEQHVRMQAAFQEHVDNAVSKTVNLPNTSTPEAIRQIYLLAWELGCKGITVFRDGCLDEQVLYKGDTLTCELDDPSCPSCSG